jgi:hypothetical protein
MGSCGLGFDHINRNAPVLIRTPKLTRFEPAQYWGGGPPGNSVVLNPFFFLGGSFLVGLFGAWCALGTPSPRVFITGCICASSCEANGGLGDPNAHSAPQKHTNKKYMETLFIGFDHINRNAPVLIRTPKLTRFEPAQYWGGGPPGNSVVLNPLFCFGGFFSCWSFWRLVCTWYTKPPCFHYRMHLCLILRGERGAW